jgi:serine protease Do
MKRKTIFTTVLVTICAAIITLFVYTHLIDRPEQTLVNMDSGSVERTAPAILTSMQIQERPVDFTNAAEQTVQAVVHVRTRSTVSYGSAYDNPLYEFFYGDRGRQRPQKVTGFGSGVIISPDGYIITNNHVIEDADSIQVTLNNNKEYNATLVGRDPDTDIALLKIKADNLPIIKFGDSDKLKLGEWVLAVGNPFNIGTTVTAGIVSAKGRSLNFDEGDNRRYKIESFIQTDAALNMGNSGGALVNTKAELVGITAAIISPTGTYSGNSFAIPVNIVKKAVGDLRQFGKVQRALIGISPTDVTSPIAEKENLKNASGVYVAAITPGGGAEEAGLKVKDVIIKINETDINSTAELQEAVSQHRPGDKITVTYIRGGKENTVSVVLKNVDNNTSVVLASTGETVFGSKVEPISSQDKKKFGIDYGVKIIDVGEGRFKEIGIKKGFIISSINGKKIKNAGEVRQATNDENKLNSIEWIQPNGAIYSYRFGN